MVSTEIGIQIWIIIVYICVYVWYEIIYYGVWIYYRIYDDIIYYYGVGIYYRMYDDIIDYGVYQVTHPRMDNCWFCNVVCKPYIII